MGAEVGVGDPMKRIIGCMRELVFDVTQEPDGGYCAECLTENIFTQGDSWEDLRRNVVEAVSAFFFDSVPPDSIRLHLVRDEVLHKSVEDSPRCFRRALDSCPLLEMGVSDAVFSAAVYVVG